MRDGKSNQSLDDLPSNKRHVASQENYAARIRRHQARIDAAQWAASRNQVAAKHTNFQSGGLCSLPDEPEHRAFAEAQAGLVFSHSGTEPSGKNANFDFRLGL